MSFSRYRRGGLLRAHHADLVCAITPRSRYRCLSYSDPYGLCASEEDESSSDSTKKACESDSYDADAAKQAIDKLASQAPAMENVLEGAAAVAAAPVVAVGATEAGTAAAGSRLLQSINSALVSAQARALANPVGSYITGFTVGVAKANAPASGQIFIPRVSPAFDTGVKHGEKVVQIWKIVDAARKLAGG